jgi:hypothetical protein
MNTLQHSTTWLLMLSTLVIGCEGQPDKEKEDQSRSEQLQRDFQDIFKSQEAERYALLSAKYNLDTARVAKLVEDYLRQQDFATYMASAVLQGKQPDSLSNKKPTPAQTIDQLSAKYSVPKTTIARIIIDYRLLILTGQRHYSQ